MSIFSNFGTFFNKLDDFFKKVFGSTNWEKTVSTTVAVIAPMVETIVTLTTNEADASKVAGVVAQIQNDLNQVVTLSNSVNASGATLEGVLNGIITNLSGLLAAGDIKDPATLSKVETVVTTVIDELKAILSVVPKN